MSGNLLSFAAAALRGPRGISPVVLDRPRYEHPERNPQGAKPAPADSGSTRYIERPRVNTGGNLYARNGALMPDASLQSASSFERSDSLDFQVTTAEGDVVTIRMNHAQTSEQSQSVQSSARGMSASLVQQDSESLTLKMRVEGNLSAEETQAIRGLMQKATDVADAFYAGNTQEAAASAEDMRLTQDGASASLASFSLDMHTEVSRKAVAMYEEVAAGGPPATISVPALDLAQATNAAPPPPPPQQPSSPPMAAGSLGAPAAPVTTDESSSVKDFFKRLMALVGQFTPTSQA